MNRFTNFRQAITEVFSTLTGKYPLLAYFLLAIIVFWPLSMGLYALQYDSVDVYLPWRFFGSESLRQGMVPLWNPYQDGGYPFYADHQYSVWNPELFIVSLLTRYNMTVIHWLFLLYISLGALGFRYLLKQLKLNKSVWFVGGVLFLLSGVIVGHAQSIISILGAVWLPWAIGSYIEALDNNFRLKDILRLVICMFLMLAAGYQAVSVMLFYLVLVLGAYQFYRLIRDKDWRKVRQFLVGHAAAGVMLGILLLGVVLSLKEVFPYLSRLSGLSLEESQLVHFHPKALWSFFYPLASVQEEYRGTSATAQNIFSGIFLFFLLVIAFRKLKSHLSPHLIILLLFGVIYGLASFGPYTPVQPLFYKFLPGCDQFFYAAFYRYFAWLALLILAAIGLQHYLEHGTRRQLLWFVSGALVFYVLSAGVSWSSWNDMRSSVDQHWAVSFRKMGWMPAQLLQSLWHVVLLFIFVLLLLRKGSPGIIRWMIVIELAVIAQLNIPVTVHGEIRTATLDNYLATKKEGFPVPSNIPSMAENDAAGIYVSIWRNQGNFTNLPCLNGWTSFHLKGREKLRTELTQLQSELSANHFAWLTNSKALPEITAFAPGSIDLALPDTGGGELIVQQANYPGWKARADGKEVDIETIHEFEQKIQVPAGTKKVELRFENPKITFLFYVTIYGFLLVLFIYWTVVLPLGSVVLRALGFTLLFGVILLRAHSFRPVSRPSVELIAGKKHLRIDHGLTFNDYLKVRNFAESAESVQLNSSMDDDPKLLSILHHVLPMMKRGELSTRTFTKGGSPDTSRITIPAKGFYDVALPDHLADGAMPEGMLLYGMDVYEEMGSDSLFFVVETKEEERTVYFAAMPINQLLYGGNHTIYTNGYLLPDLSRGRSLKMYLWNNSSKSFTFSNFKLGILD